MNRVMEFLPLKQTPCFRFDLFWRLAAGPWRLPGYDGKAPDLIQKDPSSTSLEAVVHDEGVD